MFESHDQWIEGQNDADLFLSQSREAERAVKRRHAEMITAVEQRKAEAFRQVAEKAAWKTRYEEIVVVPWETTQSERPRCSLPGLPAELRNRIYNCAIQMELECDGSAPYPLFKIETTVARDRILEGKFLALTQTSRQLRQEFRPIWLRNWATCIMFPSIGLFLDTFYPLTRDIRNAPRLLQIQWDNLPTEEWPFGSVQKGVHDITPLLRLRASCPSFRTAFIHNDVELDDHPWWPCVHCEASFQSADIDKDQHVYDDDEMDSWSPDSCNHKMSEGDVRLVDFSYDFIKPLNKLLDHGYEAWMETLRHDITTPRITVEFGVDFRQRALTVFIHFHLHSTPLDGKQESIGYALQFLRELDFRTNVRLVPNDSGNTLESGMSHDAIVEGWMRVKRTTP